MNGIVLPPGAVPVDLSAHRNNTGTSAPGHPVGGEGFDGHGRTYPAAILDHVAGTLGLPPGWGSGVPDNVTCESQRVTLPGTGAVTALHVVGAGTYGNVQDVLRLRTPDGTSTALLVGLSDALSLRPLPGETCCAEGDHLLDAEGEAIADARPHLWQTTVHCRADASCCVLELPYNPDLHLFGVWIVREAAA
ncbi:hypothetical protein [Streptomyces sp. enrichment culture]|uniref:hypothetical protein n=1 Tax=Streptomyces sp. enrichment culture TaxID=1795815 RepID=UPI003F57789C